MYNGKHLDALLAERNIRKQDLVRELNWASNRQLYQFMEGNPTASTLEKVADYFRVPIDYFFDREISECGSVPDSSQAYCEDLLKVQQRLIDEKDKRIEVLEKLLAVYEERQ